MTAPQNETLTPASKRDIPELMRFVAQYRQLFGDMPRNFFEMTLNEDFPSPVQLNDHRIWVIKNIFTGQIYGVAYAFMAADGWTHGKWLAVDPEHRGKGMGTTLFKLMVQQAKEHGHGLHFTCPEKSPANTLCLKHGARITHVVREPAGFNLNHLEMRF